jgi:hypothetical protein
VKAISYLFLENKNVFIKHFSEISIEQTLNKSIDTYIKNDNKTDTNIKERYIVLSKLISLFKRNINPDKNTINPKIILVRNNILNFDFIVILLL